MSYLGQKAAVRDAGGITVLMLQLMVWIVLAAMAIALFAVWLVARLTVIAYWRWWRREAAPYSSWSWHSLWHGRRHPDDQAAVASHEVRLSPQHDCPAVALAPTPRHAAANALPRNTSAGTLASPSQVVELSLTPEEAWRRLPGAMERVGEVKRAAAASRVLVGTARYGLDSILMKLAVVPARDRSRCHLEIECHGQDVSSLVSRKVTERLLLELG